MPNRKFVVCLVGCIAFTIFGFFAFAGLIIVPNFKTTGNIPRVHDALVLFSQFHLFLISSEIVYILLYLIQYMRYLEVKEYFMINQERFVLFVNKITFVIGFLLVISFKMYTQFKFNNDNIKFKEHINTVLFSMFIVHCFFQTIISCRMTPRMIGYFTLFLRILTVLFYITIIVINFVSEVTDNVYAAFKSLEFDLDMSYPIFKANCYAVSEWSIIVLYWLYIITYVADFDKMAISPPKIYINYASHLEYLKKTLQF